MIRFVSYILAFVLCISVSASNALSTRIGLPKILEIANDHQESISISRLGITRIFVVGDKIVSINAPMNRVLAHNDPSGSLYLTTRGNTPFTTFLSTQKGRHFSLIMSPSKIQGGTIKIIPKTQAKIKIDRHTDLAKRFESVSPYEKTLVSLIKEGMLGRLPDGYSDIPPSAFSEIEEAHIPNHVAGKPKLHTFLEKLFLGGDMSLRVIGMKNLSSHVVHFSASDFYAPGVRAVAIDSLHEGPHHTIYIYEVISHVGS